MNPDQQQSLQTFIRQVLAAVTNTSLYAADHPQVQRLVDRALESLEQAQGDEAAVALLILEETIVADDQPLPPTLSLDKFCRLLASRGIGHLKLSQGVSRDELLAFVVRLARSRDDLKSSPHIRLGQATVNRNAAGLGDEQPPASEAEARQWLAALPQREQQVQLELHETIRRGRRLHLGDLQRLVSSLVRMFTREAETLLALAPLRAMDEYIFTHSTNVCILNLAQAKSLGIQGPLLHDIGIAALLHDVGKLFVPEEILKKPGQLTEEEFALMRRHPVHGARYLLETPGVPQLAVICAFEHHMRYDLGGYPAVDADWSIHLASHLTMISDTFDAMRTRRSYQASHGQPEVMQRLQQLSGSALHPALVRNFQALLRQQRPDFLAPPA